MQQTITCVTCKKEEIKSLFETPTILPCPNCDIVRCEACAKEHNGFLPFDSEGVTKGKPFCCRIKLRPIMRTAKFSPLVSEAIFILKGEEEKKNNNNNIQKRKKKIALKNIQSFLGEGEYWLGKENETKSTRKIRKHCPRKEIY